jgi:hypothetical protein
MSDDEIDDDVPNIYWQKRKTSTFSDSLEEDEW